MRLFKFMKDGGRESTVSGLFIIEIKKLFSVVLLRFDNGSREAFHSHAFNCFSWVLKGHLEEHNLDGTVKNYRPKILPFMTFRDTFHKVFSRGTTWVLSFRGPWKDEWKEYIPAKNKFLTLTHGRKVVE